MMLTTSHYYDTYRIDGDNELKKSWLDTKGILLVNFWAEWSVQCHNMAYVMRNLKPLLHDTDAIVYIDWHHQKGWASKLGVFGVPTIIIYVTGQEIARFSGTMNETVLMGHISDIRTHVSER